jgi:peptidoglycan/LPS O-acetylase OafA/YrhL
MNAKTYFPQLTGLRAIAALLVFVHHFAFAEEKSGPFFFRLQGELYIGVSIFFVLSGFLITFRYKDERISLKQYAVNRIARIYPMYLLITILAFAFYYFHPADLRYKEVMGEENPSFTVFTNLTFLRGFFDDLKFTGVAQGWTLTVEECFYFFAPLLFFLLRKRIKLVVIAISLYATGALLVFAAQHKDWYGFFNSFQFMFLVTFFGRCFEFFAGAQLAIWMKQKNKPGKSGSSKYTIAGMLCMSAVILALTLTDVNDARYPYALYTTPGLIINNWILPVAIAVLFWGLITERTWLSRLLSTKVFELLGRSSYTFYLIHMGVISLFVVAIVKKWVLHLPVMLIISIILYSFVEEPLNKGIRKLFSGNNK